MRRVRGVIKTKIRSSAQSYAVKQSPQSVCADGRGDGLPGEGHHE